MRYFLYCRKSIEDEERQVLSLASQQEALHRSFGANDAVKIVETFEESKSAKTPGRPVFAQMMARIEAGEADGIVSWAPDRLARNSIDGGRVIYLLDTGTLRDLKFATYTFENNSQGKFMLSIMFGQSKYYSDALSENVKRGNRSKLERGWRPNRAPLGYLNDPVTKTILPDPIHFPLVRRMFEMLLSETHSPRQIALTARDEWCLRTPTRKRSGGQPIALGTLYRIFGNAFYAGTIPWNGEQYLGAHTPIVTPDEFARVQTLLKRNGQPRPQKHKFAFTGLIRCGRCAMMVTAENKTNRYGRRYTYYHCTRRGLADRCREPSLDGNAMGHAFTDFLTSLTIAPEIERWVWDRLRSQLDDAETADDAAKASREAARASLNAQMKELTGLRLRGLLGDEEFAAERTRLQTEQAALQLATNDSSVDRFELFRNVVSFSNYATEWFSDADPDTQRFVVKIAGSNFTLAAKKLSGEAVKPFRIAPKIDDVRTLCGVVDDVRTFAEVEGAALLRDIYAALDSPHAAILLQNLKLLHRQMGVEPALDENGLQPSAGTARSTVLRSPARHRGQSVHPRPEGTARQTRPARLRKAA